jgi:hypothetical protein
VTIKTRRHLSGIRYAVTVVLDDGEASPAVGDAVHLGDMAVVRLVAVRHDSPRQAEIADHRELSMTVEVLATIRLLPNIF